MYTTGCDYNDLGCKESSAFFCNPESKEAIVKKLSQEPEVVNNYPDHIVNLFGGSKAFELLPILDIGERFGYTGYIDFLTPTDLTAPIMKGIDAVSRPFVTMKIRRKSDGTVAVLTTFKRYRDPTSTYWSVGAYFTFNLDDEYESIRSGDGANADNTRTMEFIGQLMNGIQDRFELNN